MSASKTRKQNASLSDAESWQQDESHRQLTEVDVAVVVRIKTENIMSTRTGSGGHMICFRISRSGGSVVQAPVAARTSLSSLMSVSSKWVTRQGLRERRRVDVGAVLLGRGWPRCAATRAAVAPASSVGVAAGVSRAFGCARRVAAVLASTGFRSRSGARPRRGRRRSARPARGRRARTQSERRWPCGATCRFRLTCSTAATRSSARLPVLFTS